MLVAMVTNSSKARFSFGPSHCYIKKATESRVSLSLRRSVFRVSQSLGSELVSLRQLVSGISASVSLWNRKKSVLEVKRQCSSVSGIQEASSALHSE
jgi:hypothetical protein